MPVYALLEDKSHRIIGAITLVSFQPQGGYFNSWWSIGKPVSGFPQPESAISYL